MKGLEPSQLEEIRVFAQLHHSFGYVRPEDLVTKYSHGIKYIDATYDSRDKTYWCISFRGMSGNVTFRTNQWALVGPPKQWKYNNLYDLIMAYLKGEFIPKEDFCREQAQETLYQDNEADGIVFCGKCGNPK